MFKELGAFIDEVGSLTGRVIKEMLSDKDDSDRLTGIIPPKGLKDYDVSEIREETIRLDELDEANHFKLHKDNE